MRSNALKTNLLYQTVCNIGLKAKIKINKNKRLRCAMRKFLSKNSLAISMDKIKMINNSLDNLCKRSNNLIKKVPIQQ